MKRFTRREFVRLGLASMGFAGLSVSGCGNLQESRWKRNYRDITIIRNQPAGAAEREGVDSRALDDLAQVFHRMIADGLHPGAQLALYHNGKLLIELAGGLDSPLGKPVTEKTFFQIRSITKALAAVVMLMLHDRGRFSFEDAVEKHWPEFGRHGKHMITIAQIMSHRAGIPDGPRISLRDLSNRKIVARAVEAMEPIWPPGSVNGYHAASYGWVIDELVYRWEGRDVSHFLETEIKAPLGIKDLYVGLPKEEFSRMAKMVVEERVRENQFIRARFSDFLNTYEGIRLPLCWAGGVATARDLAKLMNLLAYEGTVRSVRYFSKETQEIASTPTNRPGEMDRRLRWPVRWGLGFILGDTPHIYGTPPHPRVVGHAGGSACVAWADPENRLSVAFLCNKMLGGTRWWDRYREIGDSIYGTINV
jgi:CubicO group peptidase (beta-lactamase class C family)